MIYEEESLFTLLSYNNIEDGIHTVNLNNGESIDFEIYNFYDDVEYTSNPVLGDNVTDAKMLILLYHKNLIINSDVLLVPQVRKKGILIYCKGEIINNGIISMSARGSTAAGQNIVLIDNEIVPAIGAAGGARRSISGTAIVQALAGSNGVNRQSGGGGGGGLSGWRRYSGVSYGSVGSSGTSYAGGSGGGGSRIDVNRTDALSNSKTNANGTTAGAGFVYQENSGTAISAGGGAGVIPANGAYTGGIGYYVGNYAPYAGGAGAGGLLIIFCNKISGSGYIRSRGSVGGHAWSGGGNSGGGSINLFYMTKNEIPDVNFQAEGGMTIQGLHSKGGYGGSGCITKTHLTHFYLINNRKRMYYIHNKEYKDYSEGIYGISNLNTITNTDYIFKKFKINKVLND